MGLQLKSGFVEPTLFYYHTPSILAKNMFYYIQSVGHAFCADWYYTKRKNYNSMLVLYTLNGEGTLNYNNQDYLLNKGKLFIIDCMDFQYYATRGTEVWEFIWVHFNGSESRNYVKYINKNNGPVFTLAQDSEVIKLINDIFNSFKKKDNYFEVMNNRRIVQILTELILLMNSEYINVPSMNIVVSKAIQIIENNYKNSVSLEDVAKHVNMSKYHLSRTFKKYTGFGFHEYLTAHRINEAKVLLKSSDMTIGDIAQSVGFDSASHFIKTFKQAENITPLKFRQYWRQE